MSGGVMTTTLTQVTEVAIIVACVVYVLLALVGISRR